MASEPFNELNKKFNTVTDDVSVTPKGLGRIRDTDSNVQTLTAAVGGPYYIRKHILGSSRLEPYLCYLINNKIQFYFIRIIYTRKKNMSTISSSNRYTPLFETTTFPSAEGIDIILELWMDNDNGRECIQCHMPALKVRRTGG